MDVIHNPVPSEAHSIVCMGTPREMAEMVWGGSGVEDDYSVYVAGFGVSKASADNRHNGKEAFGFTLTDSMGAREVGRLVVLDDDTWFEDQLEWKVFYSDEVTARENALILNERKSRPKVSKVTLDYAYTADSEDLDEACAIVASRFGVSLKVVSPFGPGGGWPEVEVSGLTDNVEKALRDGWEMDASEIKEHLG